MTAYTATFSTGYVKRLARSKRTYTHAWMIRVEGSGKISGLDGFAGSEQLAAQAADSSLRYFARNGYVNVLQREIVPAVTKGSAA